MRVTGPCGQLVLYILCTHIYTMAICNIVLCRGLPLYRSSFVKLSCMRIWYTAICKVAQTCVRFMPRVATSTLHYLRWIFALSYVLRSLKFCRPTTRNCHSTRKSVVYMSCRSLKKLGRDKNFRLICDIFTTGLDSPKMFS